MATAVDAVFDTAELLEAILSQLEPKDLLLSQRVSKAWKLAIAASPRLQEELFLRPLIGDHAPDVILYPDVYIGTSGCYINPISWPAEVLHPFMRKGQVHACEFPPNSDPKIIPSWHNMLVSRRAPYKISFKFGELLEQCDTSVTNAKGVRLGQIIDELKLLERHLYEQHGALTQVRVERVYGPAKPWER